MTNKNEQKTFQINFMIQQQEGFLKRLYNKFLGKFDLESKTKNIKQNNPAYFEESSLDNLNNFRNHETINHSYLSDNQKSNYLEKKTYFANRLISL